MAGPRHYQPISCKSRLASPQGGDQPGRSDDGDEAIDPIHQTAMAGDDGAGILDVEAPLESRFKQIPARTDDRKQDGKREHADARRSAEGDEHKVAASAPTERATDEARPGFFGLTAGQSFGPPTARPTK